MSNPQNTTGVRTIHGEYVGTPLGTVVQQSGRTFVYYVDVDGNFQLTHTAMLHPPFPVYQVKLAGGDTLVAAF